MKRVLFLFITILLVIFTACTQKGDGNESQEKGDSATDTVVDNAMQENQSNEPGSESGFTAFEEVKNITVDEQTFSPVYYEIEEEGYGGPWSLDNIAYIRKGQDDKLYYFSTTRDDVNTGFTHEIFTMDENNNAVIGSKIYSPTINKLEERGESFNVDEKLLDNVLVRYIYYEVSDSDLENTTVRVVIETLDTKPILAGQQDNFEAKVIMDESFTYRDLDEFSRDFGNIITTSEGPVFIQPGNPSGKGPFQITSLVSNPKNDQSILNDEYELVNGTDDIIYIDFEHGNYFVYDDSALKRIEMKSGEPLYDGAEDKILPIDENLNNYDEFYRADENSFYAIDVDDERNTVYLFSNDLELIDTVSYFASVDEQDEYEGSAYGPYNLGNGKFLMLDEYEYQRKEHMKISSVDYVF
jgi:hypothetical protein